MFRKPSLPDDEEPLPRRALLAFCGTEGKARTDGVRAIPKDGEKEPPAILELREVVEHRIKRRQKERREKETALLSDAVALQESCLKRSGTALAREVSDLVEIAFRDLEPAIKKAVREENLTQASYAAWRDERRVHRVPRYQEAKIAYCAPVMVLALVEGLMATGMYVEATQSGWLGAFVIALSVTGANVLMGFFGGLIPSRYLGGK